MSSIELYHPLKWLLDELPHYVPAEALDDLLARFAVQKRRYARALKINEARRRQKRVRSLSGGKAALQLQLYEARERKLLADQAADLVPERRKGEVNG